ARVDRGLDAVFFDRRAGGRLDNAGGLVDAGQAAVFTHLADPAGDRAVVREGVAEDEPGHAVFPFPAVGSEVVVDLLKAFLAVIVVGVDDGEGPLYDPLAG